MWLDLNIVGRNGQILLLGHSVQAVGGHSGFEDLAGLVLGLGLGLGLELGLVLGLGLGLGLVLGFVLVLGLGLRLRLRLLLVGSRVVCVLRKIRGWLVRWLERGLLGVLGWEGRIGGGVDV